MNWCQFNSNTAWKWEMCYLYFQFKALLPLFPCVQWYLCCICISSECQAQPMSVVWRVLLLIEAHVELYSKASLAGFSIAHTSDMVVLFGMQLLQCWVLLFYLLFVSVNNFWVEGKDNLTFITGSQIKYKLAGAVCGKMKSNLGCINGLLYLLYEVWG